jgi:hypothetical protein
MHRKTYKLDSSLLNWSIFESAALVTFHIHCFDIVDANPIETCAAYEKFWMCTCAHVYCMYERKANKIKKSGIRPPKKNKKKHVQACSPQKLIHLRGS